MILVSVIAADFTEEYDFTSVPTYQMPRRPIEDKNETKAEDASVSVEIGEDEEESAISSILPSFLKGKFGKE